MVYRVCVRGFRGLRVRSPSDIRLAESAEERARARAKAADAEAHPPPPAGFWSPTL